MDDSLSVRHASESGHKDAALLQLVTFNIAEEEFGVDILSVQEIIRLMQITTVPRAPACIEGVINLRGKVIPVIDMRKRFNLPAIERDSRTRIIVME
ncbi:MAG: chemotaxis protein CheW, partial [Deltaproteobacteria bacterium]|nr:chemotaxis protein CheW [Deltaproteobacteria bacterium]